MIKGLFGYQEFLQDIWKDGHAVAWENVNSGFKNPIADTVQLYQNEPVLVADHDNFVKDGENETIAEQDQE